MMMMMMMKKTNKQESKKEKSKQATKKESKNVRKKERKRRKERNKHIQFKAFMLVFADKAGDAISIAQSRYPRYATRQRAWILIEYKHHYLELRIVQLVPTKASTCPWSSRPLLIVG